MRAAPLRLGLGALLALGIACTAPEARAAFGTPSAIPDAVSRSPGQSPALRYGRLDRAIERSDDLEEWRIEDGAVIHDHLMVGECDLLRTMRRHSMPHAA